MQKCEIFAFCPDESNANLANEARQSIRDTFRTKSGQAFLHLATFGKSACFSNQVDPNEPEVTFDLLL